MNVQNALTHLQVSHQRRVVETPGGKAAGGYQGFDALVDKDVLLLQVRVFVQDGRQHRQDQRLDGLGKYTRVIY